MEPRHSILHNIGLTRCKTPWDSMPGTDRIRTCPECGKKVYDADGLNESELLALVTTSEPNTNQNVPAIYRRNDGKLMLGKSECDLIIVANRLFAWPSVALIVAAFAILTRIVHASYQIDPQWACASHIAMAGTILAMALTERLRPSLLKIKGKFPFYRIWFVCTFGGTIAMGFLLRVLNVPIWAVPTKFLASLYVFGWIATLSIAFLIFMFLKPRKTKDSGVNRIAFNSADRSLIESPPPQT